MRTNIDIDDKLLADAMKLFGLDTKEATVEEALRRALRQEQQMRAIRELFGIAEISTRCGKYGTSSFRSDRGL